MTMACDLHMNKFDGESTETLPVLLNEVILSSLLTKGRAGL